MSQTDTKKHFDQLVAECDLLIKTGKLSSVANIFSKLNLSQVPRSHRQQLAKICRRSGLISHGLRLLQPLIRNEKSRIEPATDGEICEYSVLLSRNGSIQEAMTLLGGVKATQTPEAMLYQAFCHISNWEYAEATALLEKFLTSGADNYSKLIARVNLASAYIAISEFDKAAHLLEETIPIAEQAGASRLVGNCRELFGQVYFCLEEYTKSREELNRALEIFGQTQSYDQLLIYKWQSAMKAFEEKSVEPLIKFRSEAVSRKHWESVRDADLFMVQIRYDQKMLDYLIFGTPLVAYRERIQQKVGSEPSLSFVYGNEGGPCLDLQTGHFEGSADLIPGGKIHQVIAALVKDFYVPRNMGTLFSELYPNEYFDVDSSPLRVRQLLFRTRHWLRQYKIPALVKQNFRRYSLQIQGKFAINLMLDSAPVESNSLKWIELVKAFPKGELFTAEGACQKLGWSRSTFLRLAEGAIKSGHLSKNGSGKSTSYQVHIRFQSNSLNRAG